MQRTMVHAAAIGVAATLALGGCGDDNGSSDGGGGSGYGGGGDGTTTTAQAPPATTESPAATQARAAAAATVGTASGPLGTFLVDRKGRALYLWRADKGSTSTCSGSCAVSWPPLLTTGKPKAAGQAKASLLGTTKRSNGTQVTYAGHPLYRFAGDTAAGDTNGQGSNGFGALWYVVAPSGKAITKQ